MPPSSYFTFGYACRPGLRLRLAMRKPHKVFLHAGVFRPEAPSTSALLASFSLPFSRYADCSKMQHCLSAVYPTSQVTLRRVQWDRSFKAPTLLVNKNNPARGSPSCLGNANQVKIRHPSPSSLARPMIHRRSQIPTEENRYSDGGKRKRHGQGSNEGRRPCSQGRHQGNHRSHLG
jgi:hypothetical protein